jgi:soluble lytic murein transglycosylase
MAAANFPTGSKPPKLANNAKALALRVFPTARITDWRRDPNSALGRKNPNSYHVQTGAAIDMAPIKGMTFKQAVERFKAAGVQVHRDSRDETVNPSGHATGPHWHFVLGE